MDCVDVLETETNRRRKAEFKEERRQAGAGGHILVEKIELDDLECLDLFTTTHAWVQLSNTFISSLQAGLNR
ncbi:hypothetical protein AZE42_13308 [Rhizopogon vesiculosus]|uniref:Uncharacterized protein n=1 Tax=Rhizopogon vesiculosus TaxID=180088 RepID=A0A1J8PXY0_9AGAM|nr:hypothetical protein AZE42_13308 [Rhizopogon vesiculosus]